MNENQQVEWNDGHLPQQWTIKDLLRKHASIPFNPDIARVFFLAGKIEAWGTGIERMFAACAEHGCPDPVFRHEPIGLMTTLPFIVEPAASTQNTSAKTSARITELLKENPNLTLAEIARIIGKSKRAVEMASSKLAREKKLRYVGPQKGGHWEILEDRDE